MLPRLYTDLTAWYHLVDPAEEHADEVAAYVDAFRQASEAPPRSCFTPEATA